MNVFISLYPIKILPIKVQHKRHKLHQTPYVYSLDLKCSSLITYTMMILYFSKYYYYPLSYLNISYLTKYICGFFLMVYCST